MNEQRVLQNIEDWVRAELEYEKSGHDWYHIERVTNIAKDILKDEDADAFTVLAASLFHDIADDKISTDVEASLHKIRTILKDNGVKNETIDTILDIVTTISFKGGTGKKLTYIEAQLLIR